MLPYTSCIDVPFPALVASHLITQCSSIIIQRAVGRQMFNNYLTISWKTFTVEAEQGFGRYGRGQSSVFAGLYMQVIALS